MSKNKKKADDPSRTFLLAEIFKSFNRHPNTLYNYKQLTRIIKPAFTEFLRQTKGPDASMDDLNGELKTEILFILAELQDKGDDKAVGEWINDNVPNLQEIAEDERDILLGELAENADKV